MHFSKTYSQLLLTLPPELSQSAVQYRQLKKIINQVVAELTELGLSPDVLQTVIQSNPEANDKYKQREEYPSSTFDQTSAARVIYELTNVADHLEPRLHLYLTDNPAQQGLPQPPDSPLCPRTAIQIALRSPSLIQPDEAPRLQALTGSGHGFCTASSNELIIPLAADTAFFRTLSDALEALSSHLLTRRTEFESTLQSLAHDISTTALPSSSTSSFHPYSAFSSDPAVISIPSRALSLTSKSDLDTWRSIFQLYIEADVFQGHQERFRGERDVQDAEARLAAFSYNLRERLSSGTLKFKLKQSRLAFKTFLDLNTFILDLRKFQHVTSEATRKILKKHAKRTALPLSPPLASPFAVPAPGAAHCPDRSLQVVCAEPPSLSLLLVQALTSTLLPIVPHLDDYSCVICTSLAFKPIRLRCSHLFCVRCLVKLQKRGEGHCPMCRVPTVLSADRSNVDWALLNFMKDWFPAEARKKLQQNEREAAQEEMHELGLDPRGCVVM